MPVSMMIAPMISRACATGVFDGTGHIIVYDHLYLSRASANNLNAFFCELAPCTFSHIAGKYHFDSFVV